MGKRFTCTMAAVICAMTSCMKEQAPQEETAVQNRTVAVTFTPRTEASTRSSINPDENGMKDLTVIAYRDGQLHSYARGASPTMKVSSGCTYNLYALANAGTVTPPASESTFRKNCKVKTSGIADLAGGIPMAWERKGWTPAAHSPSQSLDVPLQRLATKLSLKLDRGTLTGFTVNSVRLMNSPTSVSPFMDGGSRATEQSQVKDGDYASAADLESLNAGGTISFYSLENCQGVLLPGNTDPWKKVPSGIRSKEAVCTWIEIRGTFAPGSFYSGDVTYRIFPGRDNCTDFTLGRNTHMSISLYLSGPGLRQISWKVESNVSIDQTSATATIDGQHSKDDLYIGERFDCNVDITQDLLTYFEGDLSGVTVEFVSSAHNGKMTLGTLQRNGSDLRYTCRGCCTGEGRGDLFLVDKDGTRLMKICTGIGISEPVTVLSEQPTVGDTQRSDEYMMTGQPLLSINGDARTWHVYFTDSWGFNLNSTGSDYNLDLFSFEASVSNDACGVGSTMASSLTRGTASSGGPAVSCRASCSNPGNDADLNRALCEAVSLEGQALDIDVTETGHHLIHTIDCALDILPLTVDIVDNRWANHFTTVNSVRVKNPSNIELEIEFWQIMQTRVETYANPRPQEDINAVLRTLDMEEIRYMVPKEFNGTPDYDLDAFFPHNAPLFAMKAATITSNPAPGEGTDKMSAGEWTVHPAEGLDAGKLYSATTIGTSLCGTNLTQTGLCNYVRVSTPFMELFPPYLTVNDRLSDGSLQMEATYGREGYNDLGVWSWAGGMTDQVPGSQMDLYRLGMTDLANVCTGPETTVHLTWDKSGGRLLGRTDRTAPVNMDFQVTVRCEGHCDVWPNGISKKTYYPSATGTRTVTGVAVSSTNACIDGRIIREAIDEVANTAYWTKDKAGGKKRKKYSVPDDVYVTVQARLSDGSSTARKVSIDFAYVQNIAYWHNSHGKDYSLHMYRETADWKMYRVTPK